VNDGGDVVGWGGGLWVDAVSDAELLEMEREANRGRLKMLRAVLIGAQLHAGQGCCGMRRKVPCSAAGGFG